MNYNASLLHYPIPSLRPIIATYELNYQKGRVISLGIYSDDIIMNERSTETSVRQDAEAAGYRENKLEADWSKRNENTKTTNRRYNNICDF
jgi:hypothetical protein